MTKNPSTIWYFNDWENDQALKACSLGAQGLWKRLLCIAARSSERGVVQIGSQDSSLPNGLAQIALVVGRPLDEIAPLIDELLSSGTVSLDRKKRIYCRRMVKAAGLSLKRAESGRKGAEVTHGKRERKEPLPSKAPGKPSASSLLPASQASSHGNTNDGSPSAPAPEGARSGAPRRTHDDWKAILDAWLESGKWSPFYGLRPDSSGTNAIIPDDLWRWAKAQKAQQRSGAAA